MQIEFHFQEGFIGQPVTIMAEGVVLAELTVRTRLMIGLAEIVTLELRHGEEVRIRVGDDPALTECVSIDTLNPFVTIRIEEDGLHVAQVNRRPGYL